MNPRALVFLGLAIAAEVAGTAGLKASEEFGRLGRSALAVLGYTPAFYFLAQSLKYVPLGVAYAIWSGLEAEKRNPLGYAGIASPCKPLQRMTDHS